MKKGISYIFVFFCIIIMSCKKTPEIPLPPEEIKLISERTGYYADLISVRHIYSCMIEENTVVIRAYDKVNGKTIITEESPLIYSAVGNDTFFHHPQYSRKYVIYPQKGMNDFLAAKTKFSTLQEALDFGMTTDYVNEVTGKYVYDHLESNRDINDKEINENQDMWVYITTDSKSTPIFVTKSLYKYDPNLKRNFGLVQTSLKRSEYRFKNGLLVNDVSYYLIENNITGTEDHGDKIIKYSIIFKRISPPSKADDEIYLK